MAQGSQSNNHRRHKDPESSGLRYSYSDWEAKEAIYQRELDEARARASQMEKTMRWWSDCTSNWREKWSKVRMERNKAREEVKQCRGKLEALTKELNIMKAEKQELEKQIQSLKLENNKLLSLGEPRIAEEIDDGVELRKKSPSSISPSETHRQRASLDSHKLTNIDTTLANKLSDMKIKLHETNKHLQTERSQKSILQNKIEALTSELHNAKMELANNDRTLSSTDSSHSEVERLQNELQDEISAKQVIEERLAECRMEIERLKSENNVQWSKREMLETENISILRENKNLYNQVCELREQIHKLNRLTDTNYSVSNNSSKLTKAARPQDLHLRHNDDNDSTSDFNSEFDRETHLIDDDDQIDST